MSTGNHGGYHRSHGHWGTSGVNPPPQSTSEESSSPYVVETLQRANNNIKVAVIGAGFLGRCLAIDLSLLGVTVLVYDSSNKVSGTSLATYAHELLNPLLHLGIVTKSMIMRSCANIRVINHLSDCHEANIVIEAIPEDLEAKIALFQSLETICAPETILLTNTITLSITDLQEKLRNPGQLFGVRFFHPCIFIRPVEITLGSKTNDKVIGKLLKFLIRSLDKLPHQGPTQRRLKPEEIRSFQWQTACRGNFYHGLLEHAPALGRNGRDPLLGLLGTPMLCSFNEEDEEEWEVVSKIHI